MANFEAVITSLEQLSFQPKTLSHEAVADNKAWMAALTTLPTEQPYHVTKTLILKPKTAKSAAPTPIVVIALDTTETNATALGKKLGLKDCRFANEDLLKDTFATTKDAGKCIKAAHTVHV